MIDCPNGGIRDLLPDLLHGRLDASDRARVEQHVASCDACVAELALLRDLRSTMRRAPVIDTVAIAAAIPAYRAPVRQRAWGGWRAAAAIAAVAVGGTSIAIAGREWQTGVGSEGSTSAVHAESIAVSRSAPSIASESAGRSSAPIAESPQQSTPKGAAPSTVAEPVSLAMTGGAIGELSDRELSTLLDEIETLDALPSEEVESAGALSSAFPLEQSR
jgi:anti-sigma factor RsiW